ncbi:unnamed protein product [Pleuronectes platessa]|uniref:Uncharacterized protein n=1 Tax=Pleuronectes platessa TaxID=8262 RepID=A0A9N7Z7S9_PLEPL|nr:unnamed protein product [Pleuronectes platessa]
MGKEEKSISISISLSGRAKDTVTRRKAGAKGNGCGQTIVLERGEESKKGDDDGEKEKSKAPNRNHLPENLLEGGGPEKRNPASPLGSELFEGDPELGPGSRSTKSSRAPNPSLGSALLPQASLAVPLHHRETRSWEACEEKSKRGDDIGGSEGGASSSWARQTGFFGTPRPHTNTRSGANAHRGTYLSNFSRGSLTQCLGVEQGKTGNDKQT